MVGEFAGTFLFLFFAFTGTQVANMSSEAHDATGPEPGVLMYIALSFGFSLAVNAWVFFRISGGLFNPAVCCSLSFVAI
jgi:aquaporin related protein